MPQIEWQEAVAASATQSEASRVTSQVVPQKDWQTTAGDEPTLL